MRNRQSPKLRKSKQDQYTCHACSCQPHVTQSCAYIHILAQRCDESAPGALALLLADAAANPVNHAGPFAFQTYNRPKTNNNEQNFRFSHRNFPDPPYSTLSLSLLFRLVFDGCYEKMKFGETFTEYLHGDQERFLDKCSHVEYKRLKKVLKSCRTCKGLHGSACKTEQQEDEGKDIPESQLCQCQSSCQLCDHMFFSELMKEASDIAGCFSSRARHLLHLHVSSGMQRYVLRIRQCFKNDQQAMIEEGRVLIEYIIMNAIAIRKILKKYDKVHKSVNGKNFKSKMRAEHIELLQSPWLIELGAFYLNFNGLNCGESSEFSGHFSFDFNASRPVMTLTLPSSIKLEYDLTCAICLDIVFNPYALNCGHLFCKLCACSAASVMLFEGLKSASPDSKCPICREAGVYAKAVHMLELDLLVKRRFKEYWKERLIAERAEMVKQSKEYWDLQTIYAVGY